MTELRTLTRSTTPLGLLLALGAGAAAVAAPAATSGPELILVDVRYERDARRYHLHSVAEFTAPPEAVFAVFSDYTEVSRISGLIVDSRVLEPPSSSAPGRVHTTVKGCILFFCRTVERVETLSLSPYDEILARIEPELSDFRAGESRWVLVPLEGGGTRVDFRTEMTPAFRIPPLIGPRVIQRRLVREGDEAVANIERMALERGSSLSP